MARQSITINSVLPGWGVSEYFTQAGQFQNSVGIDPEMPKSDSVTKPSGLLRPTAMAKASGTTITSAPMFLVTNPKDTNVYIYAYDGKVFVMDVNQDMGTTLNSGTALTSSTANGAIYYNNYIYFAKNTDVCRYGPLSDTPTLDEDFWTSAPMSKTALANTTYPAIKGLKIPNHPMHVHRANSRIYFGDVSSSNVGILSMINTVKGTYEGDTNSTVVPSAYNVLDFYYGWWPTCIESLGNELAIGLIEGVSTGVKQGNAKVAFWDTLASSTSYSRLVELPDPLVTAMKVVNGQLYVFSGSASGGMRVQRYLGGESFEEVAYLDDQYPPFQAAVDSQQNRIVWGGTTTLPVASVSVFAIGAKSRNMNMGVHNILKTTSAGANGNVTSLKYVQQGASKQPIVGWSDDSAKGIDELSTTYGTSVWRSEMFRIGKTFQLPYVRIPLAAAVAANMTITVKVYTDDGSASTTIGTINSTNYTEGNRYITFHPTVNGKNNFYLELTWSGTALLPVALPIVVEFDTLVD